MLRLLLAYIILFFTVRHLFGVFLVGITDNNMCVMRTAEELTALKPVLIAALLNCACKMLDS